MAHDLGPGTPLSGLGSHVPAPIHRRNMRLRVAATTIRPLRRGGSWKAEAGNWQSIGTTEKAAVAALAGHLRQFLAHYQGPEVVAFRGYVAVVALDISHGDTALSWSQQVVDPDGRISNSSSSAGTWQQAEARARYDLAQRSTDFHDDDSVHEAAAYLARGPKLTDDRYGPAALYRDAAWQRAAQAAIAAGRDNWFAWAHKHRAEFAVPAVGSCARTGPPAA